jgi:tetratricopeptide (TPR) repeat protein
MPSSSYDRYSDSDGSPAVREFSSPEEEIDFLEIKIKELDIHEGRATSELLEFLLQLGMAYLAHGNFALGEQVLRRVRSQMVQTWGWDHTASIACLKALVDVFIYEENYYAAEDLYIDALNGIRRARGSEHPWTLELQNSVGLYYIGREDFENAIELLEKSLEGKKHVFGSNHRTYFKTEANLALLPYLQGRPAESEALMWSTFQNWRGLYSDEDADVLKLGEQLMSLYFERENPHQAHQICRELKLKGK